MEGINAPSQSQQETPGLPQCVDTLPIEVLTIIFRLSLPYTEHPYIIPVPSHREAPHNISHVSHHWRQVALALPQLWARIRFSRDETHLLPYYEAALERSSNYPLDLCLRLTEVHINDIDDRSGDQKQSILGRIFLDERHRWRNAQISIDADLSIQHRSGFLCGAPMDNLPLVEQLSISISAPDFLLYNIYGRNLCFTVDLSASMKLKRLLCSGSSLRLVLNSDVTFRHLTAISLKLRAETTLEEYKMLLKAAPALEEMSIDITLCNSGPPPHTMAISDFMPPNTQIILQKLHFFTLLIGNFQRELYEAMALAMSLLQTISAPKLDRFKFKLRAYDHNPEHTNFIKPTLCEFFKRTHPSLRCLQFPTIMSTQDLLDIIEQLPNLEELDLSCTSSWTGLIEAMTVNESHVLCPLLRKLDLSGVSCTANSMAKFIHSRIALLRLAAVEFQAQNELGEGRGGSQTTRPLALFESARFELTIPAGSGRKLRPLRRRPSIERLIACGELVLTVKTQ